MCRGDTQLVSNRLHFRNIERLLDLSVTSERGVSFKYQVILLGPLEEFGLGVEIVELDLVHGRFVLEGVTGEVLDPRNVEAIVEGNSVRGYLDEL